MAKRRIRRSLAAAIQRCADHIPFDQMMVIAADDARRLAARYCDEGVTETEILNAIVKEVLKRRDGDG